MRSLKYLEHLVMRVDAYGRRHFGCELKMQPAKPFVYLLAGPKPHELYGKFTWKIENFSEISKRELRSNVFDVGSYKW